MKVHEIAKQVGLTSKEILAFLQKNGVTIKSHLSKVDEASLALIETQYGKGVDASAPKKPSVQAAKIEEPKKKEVSKPVKEVSKKSAADTAKGAIEPQKREQPQKKDATPDREKPVSAPSAPAQRSTFQKSAPSSARREFPAKRQGWKQKRGGKYGGGKKHIPLATGSPNNRPVDQRPSFVKIKMPISVSGLATNLLVKTSELIKALMSMGIFATVNQLLDEEIVVKVAEKFNVLVEKLPSEEEQLIQVHEEKDDESNLQLRPPVVTMMGHVDHGKTSLLDAIRSSNVADRESGKITQHIGAYEVKIPGKGKVAFLDTPGHAAFTAMRSRGANITDIVILVVAADDGVMPQTIEAINHATAAETPIVVAINKSDLPNANPDKVKAELQQHGLTPEDWGGSTIMVKVSAKTGEGINELLDLLLLEAEILELKANPDRLAQGTIIEGKLSKSLGSVVNVLVQNGTLRVGDAVVCGRFYGKIRALHNDVGRNVKEAGPSTPVEILGINGVPDSGDRFYVVSDEKQARSIAEKRVLEMKEKNLVGGMKHVTLESLYEQMRDRDMKELKIIIKADVQGSVEVLKQSLAKVESDKIKLKVIHGAVGGINESDVVLAAASEAIIIGFHVKADAKAQSVVDREKVDVKYYKIIYEAINDIKLAMEGLLDPTYREVIVGTAEVQQMFKASKIGNICGCMVKKGKMVRNNFVRLIRDNIVIHDGKFSSLRRFKDDVKEVNEGYDCGIVLEGYNDVKVGDFFECYKEEKVASKL